MIEFFSSREFSGSLTSEELNHFVKKYEKYKGAELTAEQQAHLEEWKSSTADSITWPDIARQSSVERVRQQTDTTAADVV